MSFESKKSLINPDLLKWARNYISLDVNVAAKKLGIKPDVLLKWESGEESAPISKLKALSETYKWPSAIFLLNDLPPDEKVFKKFRQLFEQVNKLVEMTYDTIMSFREAIRLQGVIREAFNNKDNEFVRNIQTLRNMTDYEKVAEGVRNYLGVSVETVKGLKDSYSALNYWVRSLENQGILVLQKNFPREETRGYLLYDTQVPVIVLNTQDTPNARIFTLWHEVGHIIIGDYSIDTLETLEFEKSSTQEELACNMFASAFLLPKDNVTKESIDYADITLSVLGTLAKIFNVSKEVILRRLFELNFLDKEEFFNLLDEVKDSYKTLGEKKSSGGDYYTNFIKNNGYLLINTVFDAYSSNKISYSEALNTLNMKPKTFEKLQAKVAMMV
jgi:Zn-dependent peptidase ImmA (M78 family)